ncbi:hypothetical protein HETIRDRAFT_145080 [Heterobasidion irregulare TC 32-1]|uniref:Uncharacterized protein n=1 Tax=Heterobasidion irregulare (strain TC 32-1) TaxID=747525 RepID=W4KMD5_HETIT|nr:uncharacterized protein HETIRDRAFT_145080 [Heterobasidion irregulare TC 32-1]ETW86540.1 hypothetical protein HETIRDRAFT_145080 [Heterobasidion irregulare TC 32-1]
MLRYPRPSGAIQEGPEIRPRGEIFEFPYANLPQLESHAQPHWAILNAGMKLEHRTLAEMTALYEEVAGIYGVDLEEAQRFIGLIIQLNFQWRFATPPKGFTSQGVDITASGFAIPGPAIPRLGTVAPELAMPTVANARFQASIGTHRSIASNLLDNAKMATIRFLKSPKRSASSPEAVPSLRLPSPDRKRSRYSTKFNKKSRDP